MAWFLASRIRNPGEKSLGMSPQEPYEDVLHRAELFNCIADLVRSFPSHVGSLEDARRKVLLTEVKPLPSLQREAILPRVAVRDRRVFCNGAVLDLARRPLTLKLFEAFCRAKDQQLTREELLERVYLLGDIAKRSERYLESIHANSVKLISRARTLACAYLTAGPGSGVEWFVYDQDLKTWSLYRVSNKYLAARLG